MIPANPADLQRYIGRSAECDVAGKIVDGLVEDVNLAVGTMTLVSEAHPFVIRHTFKIEHLRYICADKRSQS